MLIKHFFVEKIAHSSYLLIGDKNCAVIDPSRDIDKYLEEAYDRGIKITHILQTHLHADFVSGHIDLAEETGAKIYMPKSAEVNFPAVELVEGDSFEIDNIKIDVLETPGHTPEHISYVITDMPRADEPIGVFTGDTLFVGDVGRPDLFPNREEELASKLYDSLKKLMKLPDYCEVYPAHGAGSLCGKAMAAKYRSTIGYEKRYNPLLKIDDKNKFIRELVENMPEVPDHFSLCSETNRKGPVMLASLPPLEAMDSECFYDKYMDGETVILDVRSYISYGGMHAENSYCIPADGNLPIFAGWIIPFDKDILLIADNDDQVFDAMVWLHRVGLDRTVGYLKGSMGKWAINGYPTNYVEQVNINEVLNLVENRGFTVIDTSDKAAYEELHIPGSINIPAPDLRVRHSELDPEEHYIVVCNSGNRSSVGASILKMNGFDNIYNLAGGMMSYRQFIKGGN